MSEPKVKWTPHSNFKSLLNPYQCQCGDTFWNVEVMEYDEKIIGVLLKCSDCGYIETVWRDE
jgi:hypothetical protein